MNLILSHLVDPPYTYPCLCNHIVFVVPIQMLPATICILLLMIDDNNGVAVVAGFDNNGRGGERDCFSHHRTNRSKLGFSKKCDTVPFSRLNFARTLKFVRPLYRRPKARGILLARAQRSVKKKNRFYSSFFGTEVLFFRGVDSCVASRVYARKNRAKTASSLSLAAGFSTDISFLNLKKAFLFYYSCFLE